MRKSANYPAVLLSVFIIVAVYVYLTQNDDTLEQPLYTLAPELPHAPPLQLPTADHAVPVPATWPRSLGIPAAEIKQIEVEEKLINTTTWDTNGPPIPVLGVTVFVNADLLLRLLNSIDYHVEHIVIIHSGTHPLVTKILRQLRQEKPEWTIQSYPKNMGCAGGWNKVLEAIPARYHIISNDDIAFYPGALRRFALGIEQKIKMFEQGQSNKVILYPSHGNAMWGSPPWSCFAILKQCVDTIGKFDENFWPVYHEDYDYMVRMARAGFWQTLIPEAKVQHGWSTGKYEPGMERANKDQGKLAVLDEYNKQQRRHERGSPYYAMKWGIGETPGIYDAGNGYWNQTCSMGPQGRVCTPREHVLYAHPFNDSSLPLSFWKLDPALRNCLQYGENPPCRYNHRLLPNPSKVPHDIYSPGSRRWRRKEVVAGSVAGEWIPSAEIKALLEDQYHSRCFVQGCHVHGPEASIDGDFGSFFAFPGTSGFVTYDLGKCFKVRQMMYHSSEPCDPADAVEFLLQASPSKEGPWADVQQYTAQCNGRWSLSPLFSVDTRFVRLQILRNNGYSGGARIPEVSFYQAEEPCAAAQK